MEQTVHYLLCGTIVFTILVFVALGLFIWLVVEYGLAVELPESHECAAEHWLLRRPACAYPDCRRLFEWTLVLFVTESARARSYYSS